MVLTKFMVKNCIQNDMYECMHVGKAFKSLYIKQEATQVRNNMPEYTCIFSKYVKKKVNNAGQK